MNPFEQFLADTVILRKPDGTEVTDIRASVQDGKISVFDVALRIEPDDRVVRLLPNGQMEEFIVEEANYRQAFHAIPAHWTILCRRSNQPPVAPQSVTYHVSGANARINVQSHDNSTNISRPESPAVFLELQRAASAQITDEIERQRMLERIEELEGSHGTSAFLARYQGFVAAAANHMTIFAPLLPALTILLSHEI